MFGKFGRITAKIIKKFDNTAKIAASLAALQKQTILIGIPQEKSSRKGNPPITNAELAFIHSKGSPAKNIPARPFLESIDASKERIANQQAKIVKAALDGKKEQMKMQIEKLGILGVTIAKAWFVDPKNNWAPNRPATIQRKGSDKPLIDTGQLRNAITYVVRDK